MSDTSTGPRGPIRVDPPGRYPFVGTSRRWSRTLRGVPHGFTAVAMPDGERRYFVTRYNGYGDDGTAEGRASGMRFGCAWSPVASWTLRPRRVLREVHDVAARDLKVGDRLDHNAVAGLDHWYDAVGWPEPGTAVEVSAPVTSGGSDDYGDVVTVPLSDGSTPEVLPDIRVTVTRVRYVY